MEPLPIKVPPNLILPTLDLHQPKRPAQVKVPLRVDKHAAARRGVEPERRRGRVGRHGGARLVDDVAVVDGARRGLHAV